MEVRYDPGRDELTLETPKMVCGATTTIEAAEGITLELGSQGTVVQARIRGIRKLVDGLRAAARRPATDRGAEEGEAPEAARTRILQATAERLEKAAVQHGAESQALADAALEASGSLRAVISMATLWKGRRG